MAKPTVEEDAVPVAGHLRDWFSDPAALLRFRQLPLDKMKDDCIFVLDANVLLLPYASSSKPFAEIVKLYESLIMQGRLFVPAQAMREFLGLRAKKLGEIAKQLADYQSQLSIPALPRLPLLLDDADYVNAQTETKKAGDIKAARDAVAAIIDKLRGPIGTDPVSIAYQNLFVDALLEETEDHFKTASADLKIRYAQKRPPGFSDAGKPDGGIGDLLIWQSLIRLGATSKRHCVFVSSDRKPDWWVQANGAFQPRLELIEEYRAASEGHTLHLALLGDVLELAGASSKTVEEVRAIEEPPEATKMLRLLRHARSLQQAGWSRRSPDFYWRRASVLESRVAEGLGTEKDLENARRYRQIAEHLENQKRRSSEDLIRFEGELAAQRLELVRDDAGTVVGIGPISGTE